MKTLKGMIWFSREYNIIIRHIYVPYQFAIYPRALKVAQIFFLKCRGLRPSNTKGTSKHI